MKFISTHCSLEEVLDPVLKKILGTTITQGLLMGIPILTMHVSTHWDPAFKLKWDIIFPFPGG